MKYQYSLSRLDAYEECPQKFKFMLDRAPFEAGSALVIGGKAHKIFEQYAEGCLKEKCEYDPGFALGLLAAQKSDLAAEDFLTLSGIVKTFVDSHSFTKIEGVEVFFEQRIVLREDWTEANGWYDMDVFFRGIIDVLTIEGRLAIIRDYKTNKWVNHNTINESFQIPLYAYLAMVLNPALRAFTGELDFVRHNVVKKRDISLQEVLQVPSKIMERVLKIEAETEWKPNPRPRCAKWCGYAAICPAMRHSGVKKSNER